MHAGEEPTAGEEAHEHPRSDPGIVADAPAWLTPLTSMFLHGGLLQLTGSVVLLLIFGSRLERRIGRPRFLALFALAGLATAAALIGLAPDLPIATLGATGAVAGVVGAHLALFRAARLTWFEVPAPALLGAAILLQLAVVDADARPTGGRHGRRHRLPHPGDRPDPGVPRRRPRPTTRSGGAQHLIAGEPATRDELASGSTPSEAQRRASWRVTIHGDTAGRYGSPRAASRWLRVVI
jgi:hypothetical protein